MGRDCVLLPPTIGCWARRQVLNFAEGHYQVVISKLSFKVAVPPSCCRCPISLDPWISASKATCALHIAGGAMVVVDCIEGFSVAQRVTPKLLVDKATAWTAGLLFHWQAGPPFSVQCSRRMWRSGTSILPSTSLGLREGPAERHQSAHRHSGDI